MATIFTSIIIFAIATRLIPHLDNVAVVTALGMFAAVYLSKKQAVALGFNDSSVHTDIVSTTKRTVTAHMIDGTKRVIYRNGMFVL